MAWEMKRKERSGHGKARGPRRRGTPGAFGRIIGSPRVAYDPKERLSQDELRIFFQEAVGVHPSQSPAFMRKPIYMLRSDTLKVAIQFIDQRLKRCRKATTRETLAGIRAKMQAVLDERSAQPKKKESK